MKNEASLLYYSHLGVFNNAFHSSTEFSSGERLNALPCKLLACVSYYYICAFKIGHTMFRRKFIGGGAEVNFAGENSFRKVVQNDHKD